MMSKPSVMFSGLHVISIPKRKKENVSWTYIFLKMFFSVAQIGKSLWCAIFGNKVDYVDVYVRGQMGQMLSNLLPRYVFFAVVKSLGIG